MCSSPDDLRGRGGRRTVTTEELYEFARIYVTPVSTLLSEVAPRAEDVERVLFRRTTSAGSAARRSVRRLMLRCRTEKELENSLGLAAPTSARPAYRVPSPRSTGEAVRQGELIAGQERPGSASAGNRCGIRWSCWSGRE